MKSVTTLGEFLLREMDSRKMSARAFADFVGVSHGVIQKFLNHGTKDVGNPSIDVLIKIAEHTNTDICYLLALIAPHVTKASRFDVNSMILSQRIELLPEHIREIVDDIITKHVGESAHQGNQG